MNMSAIEKTGTDNRQEEDVILTSSEERLKAVQDETRLKLEHMKVLFSEIQEIQKNVQLSHAKLGYSDRLDKEALWEVVLNLKVPTEPVLKMDFPHSKNGA